MNTQTLSNPSLCEILFALPVAETIQADSRDYGFDFNEDELGRELLASLPSSFANRSLPEMDADEFEERYSWFVS